MSRFIPEIPADMCNGCCKKGISSAEDIMKNAIISHCPDGRERALALTNLEQAVMWAEKSVRITMNGTTKIRA